MKNILIGACIGIGMHVIAWIAIFSLILLCPNTQGCHAFGIVLLVFANPYVALLRALGMRSIDEIAFHIQPESVGFSGPVLDDVSMFTIIGMNLLIAATCGALVYGTIQAIRKRTK